MDQSQKLFPLQRGDCALAFCGDAQVAYPFFIQAGSALNSFIKTRTRAADICQITGNVGLILDNLISSWDLRANRKKEVLDDTRVLLGGWSWKYNRFELGYYKYEDDRFVHHHRTHGLPFPWKERSKSLIFIGDYQSDYMKELQSVLSERHPRPLAFAKKTIDLQYEPVEALERLLRKSDRASRIGGAPQMIKIYPHSNVLPIVSRLADGSHFSFGRKMFEWEKTEYPIADFTSSPLRFYYPLAEVPLPHDLYPDRRARVVFRGLIRLLTSRGA